MKPSVIMSVTAMQTSTDQSKPAVSVTVITAGGAQGIGIANESYSTSDYRPKYLYDHTGRYHGNGVMTAAGIIEKVVAPALIGLDAARQGEVDHAIKKSLSEAGFPSYVNLSAPVSVAALKAGAAALEIPLFRHIGGQSAFTLPIGGYMAASGGKRYGNGERSEGRPVYNLVSYGFDSFEEAHYALWETANTYEKLLAKEAGLLVHRGFSLAVPRGRLESDRSLLDIMSKAIEAAGHRGKIGIHIDVGANEFYDTQTGVYRGLFDTEEKTGVQMVSLYKELVKAYPLVMLQDPLEQHDTAGFAELTASTGIQIVGGDLFGTDVARIKSCVMADCVNSVLLPVCAFETFSDVIELTRFVKSRGADVMLQDLSGEGLDIADFSVGFRAGTVYQGGLDPLGNRLISTEKLIGPRARFYGVRGLQGSKFALRQSV